jgi:hypothetical protein
MKRALFFVLLSAPVLAADVDVPLGARAPLKSKKLIHEVVVRDPSLLSVVVTDGAVSLEGKQSGVTGITVTYEDGEREQMLVTVGDSTNSKGPRMEQAKTVDLKQTADAQAKTPRVEPKKPAKARGAN